MSDPRIYPCTIGYDWSHSWDNTLIPVKDWEILDTQFRHDLRVHRDVFAAIAVLSQIAIQYNGEDLFQVEYSDQMEE